MVAKEILIVAFFLLNALLIKSGFSILKVQICESLKLSAREFTISSSLAATTYAISQLFASFLILLNPKRYIILVTVIISSTLCLLSYAQDFLSFLIIRFILYTTLGGANIIFTYILVNTLPRKLIGKTQSTIKMILAIVVFLFFNNPFISIQGDMWKVLYFGFSASILLCLLGFLLLNFNFKKNTVKKNTSNYRILDPFICILSLAVGLVSIGVTFITDGYLVYFNRNFSTISIGLATLLYPVIGLCMNLLEPWISNINIMIITTMVHIAISVLNFFIFSQITAIMFTISSAAVYAFISPISCIINNTFSKQLSSIYVSIVNASQVFIANSIGSQIFSISIYHLWKYHGTCNIKGTPIYNLFELKYIFAIVILTSILGLLCLFICKYYYKEMCKNS